MHKKLTPEAMKVLGFTSLMPRGNPTEPWWEHPNATIPTFYRIPTAKQLIDQLQKDAFDRGVKSVRTELKKTLGLAY